MKCYVCAREVKYFCLTPDDANRDDRIYFACTHENCSQYGIIKIKFK